MCGCLGLHMITELFLKSDEKISMKSPVQGILYKPALINYSVSQLIVKYLRRSNAIYMF
jgi:hypothetical protein